MLTKVVRPFAMTNVAQVPPISPIFFTEKLKHNKMLNIVLQIYVCQFTVGGGKPVIDCCSGKNCV